MLAKLEDKILFTVWKLRGKAYSVNVHQELTKIVDSKVAVGVVYFTLDRLTKRGLLQSYKADEVSAVNV